MILEEVGNICDRMPEVIDSQDCHVSATYRIVRKIPFIAVREAMGLLKSTAGRSDSLDFDRPSKHNDTGI